MFEHNKTLGISYALHVLFKARTHFSQSSTLYYEKFHSLTVKKIIIRYTNAFSHLYRAFSERFATNFYSESSERYWG